MRTHSGRNLNIIVAALFFFTSLGLAIHHDDLPFQSISCSTCKVKGAATGTPQKIKTDFSFSVTVNPSLVAEACLVYSGRVPEAVVFHSSSNYFFAFNNKAPPIQL
ncbi:MAG: hypothetical protein NT072_12755 [Deltaproteobacteria bacterium]|nr:hypothetical protein [Deltaproteobacteria bacterium]